MKRCISVIALMLIASPVGAQPQPTEDPYQEPPPSPTVAPQQGYYPPAHDPRAARRYQKHRERQVHQMLMDTDPEYRSARSRRTTGIVLTSVGGVALLAGAVAGMIYGICQSVDGGSDCRTAAWWTIGGLATGAVGLAVGLTMVVSGHRQMKAIRARALYHGGLVPEVKLGMGQLGLRWQF